MNSTFEKYHQDFRRNKSKTDDNTVFVDLPPVYLPKFRSPRNIKEIQWRKAKTFGIAFQEALDELSDKDDDDD